MIPGCVAETCAMVVKLDAVSIMNIEIIPGSFVGLFWVFPPIHLPRRPNGAAPAPRLNSMIVLLFLFDCCTWVKL